MLVKGKFIILGILVISAVIINASDHGIYLMTNKSVKSDIETIASQIINSAKPKQF